MNESFRAACLRHVSKTIEEGKCLIIGEVAQSHDGSLGTAHAFVDAIADAGADAVKFQTHIAHAESTPGEPWRVKFSRQDETRYEYWQRMDPRSRAAARRRRGRSPAGSGRPAICPSACG